MTLKRLESGGVNVFLGNTRNCHLKILTCRLLGQCRRDAASRDLGSILKAIPYHYYVTYYLLCR